MLCNFKEIVRFTVTIEMNWENMQLSKINKKLKKSYLQVFNRMAVLKT